MPLLVRFLRYCFLSSISLLTSVWCYAQSPAPVWESAISMGQRELTNTLATDSKVVVTSVPDGQGNLYVAGYFVGTVTFGTTTLVSTLFTGYTNAYSSDIFVAKWSVRDNRYLWVARASGPSSESATQLVVSGSDLYIAGATSSRLNVPGSLSFGATTLATGTSYSVFVAKLTDTGSGGTWRWGKTGNSEYLASVAGLAVTGTAVYLAGDLAGTMTCDGKTVKSNQTLAYNAADLLLLKFTDGGSTATLNWMQLAGSATYEQADALAVSGNTLYVAGDYFNTSTIGGTTMPNTGTGGTRDAFVTKFTDAGTAATIGWSQHIGGTGTDLVSSLVVNGNSVYVAGDYASPSVGFGTPVTVTLTNQDPIVPTTSDLFVVKLVDAGASSSVAWAKQLGGAGSEQAAHLLQVGSALFLGGSFYGPTATFGNTVLTNASSQGNQADVYVARLDETATGPALTWAQQAGSTSYDYVYSLNLLGNKLYVLGFAQDAATFGPFTLPNASSYLSSLSPNAPLAALHAAALPAFTLYPNPARTQLTAHVPGMAGATQATLTLRNALGQVVQTSIVSLPTTGLAVPLSIAGLTSGVYFVQLQAGMTNAVRQLVVE